MFLFVAFMGLFGCQQPTPTTPTPTVPSGQHNWPNADNVVDTAEDCFLGVLQSTPEDNEDNVYYRTAVRVELSSPDPSATINVFTEDGDEVAGDTTVDDVQLTWGWDEPLLPLTSYRMVVSHKCDDEEIEFTTSEVGLPLEGDILDNTYALNVADGDWVSPPRVDPLFAGLLQPVRLLLQVVDTSQADSLDLLSGIWFDGSQNFCAPTVPIVDASWLDPYFAVPPGTMTLSTATFDLTVEDLIIEGAFAPDGSHLQGAVLAGVLDTRDLGPALLLPDDPEAVCRLLDAFAVYCDPCSSDGGVFCLDLRVEDVDAPRVPYALQEVLEEAIPPDCEP